MQKEHLTPVAILAGSIIIGAGLYFGLQHREPPPAPPAPPADARPAARSPERQPPAVAPAAPPPVGVGVGAGVAGPGLGLSPPPVSADVRKAAEQAVARALEAKRAELVKTCWDPSFKKSAEPPRAKYIFNVSFDPSGKEIARGISEVRGMERSDTAQCLRSQPMGLQIPAPGAYVGVEVELLLP